eukprot:6196326-Pleurochrysis_carterae.AAC.2
MHLASGRGASRAIAHVDLDYFYAQVEVLRHPHLRESPSTPVAVTQKFLVVTCNYAARAHGVSKLMRTEAALRACPALVLVAGEDLTPYRAASDAVFEALCAWGATQRVGLDEFFVDLTARADAMLNGDGHASGASFAHAHAHAHSDAGASFVDAHAADVLGFSAEAYVHSATTRTTTAEALAGAATNYRPMDLRSACAPAGAEALTLPHAPHAHNASALLRAASHTLSAIRKDVRDKTGLTCSAGLSTNKLVRAHGRSHRAKPERVKAPPQPQCRRRSERGDAQRLRLTASQCPGSHAATPSHANMGTRERAALRVGRRAQTAAAQTLDEGAVAAVIVACARATSSLRLRARALGPQLSKLASGLRKPDGLSLLLPSEARDFLEPLSVRVFPGGSPPLALTPPRNASAYARPSATARVRSLSAPHVEALHVEIGNVPSTELVDAVEQRFCCFHSAQEVDQFFLVVSACSILTALQ